MKALIGSFTTESNAHVPMRNDITNYVIGFGDDCVKHMQVGDVFAQAGVEVIPAIYATAGASGVIKKEAFDYIEACFARTAREHLHEIDGVYLHLHGASEVEEIGSGDHRILKTLREILGPYVPICISVDPHGNLCQEYVESAAIVRSYRESPHTDALNTQRKVAGMLCDLLKNRQNIHAVYRKLPLILGGEQSVSTDEPVKTINAYMDELEKDPRILSASWHVGYIRHDCPVAGCGVVVTPATEADQAYAGEVADKLAAYVWEKRHEFHYTGFTAKPAEALKTALEHEGKPVFITDSGDNTTSGATGWNTYVLRQVLAEKDLKKRFLFSNICDPEAFKQLDGLAVGTKVKFTLGVDYDEWSRPVELEGTVKHQGMLRGYMMHPHDACYGYAVTVSLEGLPVDVVVASTRQTMCEEHQFRGLDLDWNDYDVVVVKQGYIFPELKAAGSLSIMSLTGGATLQDTAAIPFKMIMRPMFPVDDI